MELRCFTKRWFRFCQNYDLGCCSSSFSFHDANVPQNLSDGGLMPLNKLCENNNLVVQKADKGNSVVSVNRKVFVNHMENTLKDNIKFGRVDIKTR